MNKTRRRKAKRRRKTGRLSSAIVVQAICLADEDQLIHEEFHQSIKKALGRVRDGYVLNIPGASAARKK